MEAWRKIYASCWLGPPDGRGCMVPPGLDSFPAKMGCSAPGRHPSAGSHQRPRLYVSGLKMHVLLFASWRTLRVRCVAANIEGRVES